MLVGVVALKTIDVFLYRKLNFEEEIKQDNIAAALFASVLVLFVAILLAAARSK